ncbi:MAG TPA: nicotinate (nicotinamide) nucleotide adenylyltransferase [Candidatus Marinimicrobia bacterium]|nr:nicotinate (nicotinamide) nucleotide adenylyltransferase [Candidatus Neomarinimicrobiota bacterium]
MKLGLYGGTFDPPHNGHLAIAQQCLTQFQLNRILFIPTYIPPHKTSREISTARNRLAMLRLALQPFPDFEISKVEIERRGVSYSIDTILQIKKELNLERKDLYFLIGIDSLAEFHSWYQPQRIMAEAQVVVAARPQYSLTDIAVEFCEQVEFLSNPLIDISASTIRQKVKNGEPICGLVPEKVAEYILCHQLYKS